MMATLDNLFPWLGDMLELGGQVLLVILALAAFLWALILERFLFIRFVYPRFACHARQAWQARSDRCSWFAQQYRTRLLARVSRAMNQRLSLVGTLIKVAPLLGLLGTVIGMLEVFDAVAATGSSNPRSTASGVSKATVSTMAGMVVAISGLLASSFLSRSAAKAHENLANELVFSHGEQSAEVGK